MKIPLFCHWRADNDIACAFVEYYMRFCSEIHIILHGPPQESAGLIGLARHYPLKLRYHYQRPFDETVKTAILEKFISEFADRWVFIVDSDEFVELPHSSIAHTIASLEEAGATSLSAPMLQRLRIDFTLDSADPVSDPFVEFPFCSPNLYALMGSTGSTGKFPLIKASKATKLQLGNHFPPNGPSSAHSRMRGVTHHFKWRRGAVKKISRMIEIKWPWAKTEAQPYLDYLKAHNGLLPQEGSFPYSREELFRRGYLCT